MPRPLRMIAWLTAVLLLGHSSWVFGTPAPSRSVLDHSGPKMHHGRTDFVSATEQQEVEAALEILGYAANEAKAILALLSPADTRQLALNIRQLQVAGGSRTRVLVGIAVAAVVLVALFVIAFKPGSNFVFSR